MRQFYFHFFILYLVSRAFTWHAAMFGLGVRQGEFWVNVVTARKAGVAIVHAHKIVQFCANDNNAQLCQIVQQGGDFAHTHCKPSHSAHVIISHISGTSYILSKKVFLWTASDWIQNVEKPGYIYVGWPDGTGGTTSGGGSYTRDNDRTNTHSPNATPM